MENNKKELQGENNHASEHKHGNMHIIKKGTSTKGNIYTETYEDANQELDQPAPAANNNQNGSGTKRSGGNKS